MNNRILNTEIQNFINDNLSSDVAGLLLKGISFVGIEARKIIEQIETKKKCKTKLPTWFNSESIYYSNKLNIEQTSSEITASYKSQLISGNSIIDITGGFGVDSYYFSKHFKSIIHCEIDEDLSQIVKHNYKQLNAININTQNVDGIENIRTTLKSFDWIYADPSRRHETKGKVFFLKDCLPNIPEHLEMLFEHSNSILIKTSPLLDISIGISELKFVKSIHIIAVNNEVKELLWVLEKNFNEDIYINTVNIKNNEQENFSFKLIDEQNAEVNYSLPLTYLYEPNSTILKAGAFKSISKQFKISKLHQHSHLYTSKDLISFPGRHFKIIEVLPYNKKVIRKTLGAKKANVTVRNFPETVNQIKNKFNIQDGGDLYVFFTINLDNERIVILSSKT
ncbi:class I SAM-dependent methyltransferase [Flavobacteriaceae bacterium AH-315-B10]|nr:class I SAM-dependent methyltransferase [Flavobacteriaceae bacterium AH-315-B10]